MPFWKKKPIVRSKEHYFFFEAYIHIDNQVAKFGLLREDSYQKGPLANFWMSDFWRLSITERDGSSVKIFLPHWIKCCREYYDKPRFRKAIIYLVEMDASFPIRDDEISREVLWDSDNDIQRPLLPDIKNISVEKAEIISDSIQELYVEAMTMTQIEVKLGNGVTIGGDFVVANSIKDSFNKAESSDASDELRDLLKRLSVAVGKMSEQMPKKTAQQVARDLDSLVAEATSLAPRKKWWQLSIEGLQKAAQDIGSIGKPVLELAGKIVSLLLNKSV